MIQPNTTLILIKNIPFDNTYEHTVSYANREAQHADLVQGTEGVNYFTVGTMTYQRYTKNSIRIQKPIEEIIECNYMCYKNTNYENRWVYAFITRMEYVNDITTEIEYEIDVMQTWFLFDTVKEMSFIEREHTETDEIGDNIVEEGLTVGEYIFERYQKLENALDDMTIIAAIAESKNATVRNYDNLISGCLLFAYRNNKSGRQALQNKLESYIQRPEAVVSLYVVPSILVADIDSSTGMIADNKSGTVFNLSGEQLDGNETFGSEKDGAPIVPKNNKLYTYPYNFYHVENNAGNSLDLRYEMFTNLLPTFEAYGTFTQPVSIVMHPTNYKLSQLRTDDTNFSESLTLENYPVCSWSNDAYRNWLTTEIIPIAINGVVPVMQMLSGFFSASTGNYFGGMRDMENGGHNLFNQAVRVASQNYRASIKADVLRGSIANTNVNLAHRAHNFYGARVRITSEYMKIIDDFFSMFGYAVNRVKRIQTRNRENWTYVKTNGANLHGKCGNVYNRKMMSILDNGITFWKDSISKVCNYNLSNNPL